VSERILVARNGPHRRIVRLSALAELHTEEQGRRWAVVAELVTGAPAITLAEGLPPSVARQLCDELEHWISTRGGNRFDFSEWFLLRQALRRAGKRDTGRSIPMPRAAGE
jgi:hypothetical protein